MNMSNKIEDFLNREPEKTRKEKIKEVLITILITGLFIVMILTASFKVLP